MNTDYSSAWYGTYKLAPDGKSIHMTSQLRHTDQLLEPNPNPTGVLYPPSVYVRIENYYE